MWKSSCANVQFAYQGGGQATNLLQCDNGSCSNIVIHTCLSSDGQSGSGMWDANYTQHAILTGKVHFPQPWVPHHTAQGVAVAAGVLASRPDAGAAGRAAIQGQQVWGDQHRCGRAQHVDQRQVAQTCLHNQLRRCSRGLERLTLPHRQSQPAELSLTASRRSRTLTATATTWAPGWTCLSTTRWPRCVRWALPCMPCLAASVDVFVCNTLAAVRVLGPALHAVQLDAPV